MIQAESAIVILLPIIPARHFEDASFVEQLSRECEARGRKSAPPRTRPLLVVDNRRGMRP